MATCSYNCMNFINEQDYLTIWISHFLQDSFQPILKFSSKFCTSYKRTHIKGDQLWEKIEVKKIRLSVAELPS